MEEKTKNNKGKLILLIVIAIVAIALIVTGIMIMINSNKTKSNVQITGTEDMQNLINTVYEGQTDNLPPTLNTQIIDVNNLDVLKYFTGLESNESIESAVASEPMIGSKVLSTSTFII